MRIDQESGGAGGSQAHSGHQEESVAGLTGPWVEVDGCEVSQLPWNDALEESPFDAEERMQSRWTLNQVCVKRKPCAGWKSA